jgi:glycosyltransferase involved in cell wall biosynthesis
MRTVAVINAMKSRRPTGIGIAGDAVAQLLPAGVAMTSPRLDRLFFAVNNEPLPGPRRALLRLLLVQCAPFFFPRNARLIFTAHNAPFWRTGRHALILYDTIPLQFPEQAPAQSRYYRRALPRALRCAERIVAISAATRDDFVARGFAAVKQATVIPSFSAALGRGVENRKVARSRNELLVVGARYAHKNIDVVLAALVKLNEAPPAPWRLTLAGADRLLWAKPWGGLEFFEQRGWVRAIPHVDEAELAALYAGAAALVYPSLAEGQGLPPLEAMAAGCPAICSDLPVLRETCGDAAVYFPATDAVALAQLIAGVAAGADEAAAARLAAAARERLAGFSREALAARWREFLEAWR